MIICWSKDIALVIGHVLSTLNKAVHHRTSRLITHASVSVLVIILFVAFNDIYVSKRLLKHDNFTLFRASLTYIEIFQPLCVWLHGLRTEATICFYWSDSMGLWKDWLLCAVKVSFYEWVGVLNLNNFTLPSSIKLHHVWTTFLHIRIWIAAALFVVGSHLITCCLRSLQSRNWGYTCVSILGWNHIVQNTCKSAVELNFLMRFFSLPDLSIFTFDRLLVISERDAVTFAIFCWNRLIFQFWLKDFRRQTIHM